MIEKVLWVSGLRKNIGSNFGKGWRVIGEASGLTKLTYVYQEFKGTENKKTAKTLPIKWEPTSQVEILKAIEFIKPLVVEKNLTLNEAARRWKAQFIGEEKTAPNKNWNDFLLIPPLKGRLKTDKEEDRKNYAAYKKEAAKVDQFMTTKLGLSRKTEKDWGRRINRFLEVMNKKPAPNTGTQLIKLCAENFGEIEPDEKKRYLDAWCEILKYGITRHSMNERRWQPPDEDYRKELIGKSNRNEDDKLTPYVEESDLFNLLDSLESTNKELFLATALIALFGLRLSELAVLTVRDGKLYVGHIKKNVNTSSKKREPRRAFAMDLVEKPNLGAKVLRLYESGLIKLPKAVLNQIEKVQEKNTFGDVGQAYVQILERNELWKNIVKTNSDITPYSLRHRFAHQCHKGSTVPLSVKDAAAAMGHTPATHMSFYARYTTELSVAKAFDRHLQNRISV